jgi:hypothetical protein
MGAEPRAERFAQKKRHQKERRENEESGGMNARDFASQQNVLELHQPSDWQPAFDAGRPRDLRRSSGGLKPNAPTGRTGYRPIDSESEKQAEAKAQVLRVVGIGASDELLTGRREIVGLGAFSDGNSVDLERLVSGCDAAIIVNSDYRRLVAGNYDFGHKSQFLPKQLLRTQRI